MFTKPLAALACILTTLFIGGIAHCAHVAIATTLNGALVGSSETNLGDMIADAVRLVGGADCAMVAATEIRAVSIPAGDVDSQRIVDTIRAASDATDTVYTLRLTGTQIRGALEHAVSRTPSAYDGFLQVSGILFTYDKSRPEGSRVADIQLDGKPIDPAQTYTVATTRLLADGALGYFEVWDKTAILRDTAVAVSKTVSDYAVAHSPLSYTVGGRITSR